MGYSVVKVREQQRCVQTSPAAPRSGTTGALLLLNSHMGCLIIGCRFVSRISGGDHRQQQQNTAYTAEVGFRRYYRPEEPLRSSIYLFVMQGTFWLAL
jgi:hypothetical protein